MNSDIKCLSDQEMSFLISLKDPVKVKTAVQDIVYKNWVNSGRSGTNELATGVGKTRVALKAIDDEIKSNPDALIYVAVPTQALRDVDWPKEAKEAGYEESFKKVKIICWASLSKEVPERDVDLFIGDEIHRITPVNCKFFSPDNSWKIKSKMGLSATIPVKAAYEDSAESLKIEILKELFPSIFHISLEQAVQLQLVSEFNIVTLFFDLDDTHPYISAGSAKKGKFKTTERKAYDYATKQLKRATFSKQEGLKFVWIQNRVEILNSLKTKDSLAKEVLEKLLNDDDKKDRVIVFCSSIAQSERICNEKVFNSGTDDTYLNMFQEEQSNLLGVVQALNEGTNLKNVDKLLIAGFNSKELTLIQRIGRAVRWRPGHVAKVVILVAKSTAEEKWYRNAIQSFDKSRIKEYHVRTNISTEIE